MTTFLRRAVTGPLLALLLASGATVASPAHALADRDCGDFASQKAAQIFFLEQGGPSADPHNLDSEGDGIACETNPAPYYYEKALPTGTTTTTSSPTLPAQIRQRARVTRVVDGDTIDVRLRSGKQKRVRMIGIDTPEVYGGVECGGKKASSSMRRLAPVGTRVLLLSDPTQDRADRYGRLLRYVVKAGQDLNRAQVARGWARVYVYGNNPFRRVSTYRRAQRAADSHDRGIWRLCR